MNNDHRPVWERYVSSWKTHTKEEKAALLDGSVHPECVYTDPLTQARGWEALVKYMLEFHQQAPGAHFVTEYFLSHHRRSIARWKMVNAASERIGEGISYGEYDESGRLTAMTGFFEAPPTSP